MARHSCARRVGCCAAVEGSRSPARVRDVLHCARPRSDDPDVQVRQAAYLEALRRSGSVDLIEFGRFYEVVRTRPLCNSRSEGPSHSRKAHTHGAGRRPRREALRRKPRLPLADRHPHGLDGRRSGRPERLRSGLSGRLRSLADTRGYHQSTWAASGGREAAAPPRRGDAGTGSINCPWPASKAASSLIPLAESPSPRVGSRGLPGTSSERYRAPNPPGFAVARVFFAGSRAGQPDSRGARLARGAPAIPPARAENP